MKRASIFLSLASFLLLCVVGVTTEADTSYAQTASSTADIQSQIDAQNASISSIQKDIDAYQAQLNTLSTQKQTLTTSISSLDISREKAQAAIAQDQAKIKAANLQLNQLGSQIQTKEQAISLDQQVLGQSLRQINNDDDLPSIALLFTSNNFEEVVADIGSELQLAGALKSNADQLSNDKVVLSTQQSQVSSTKDTLTQDNQSLTTQKGQLDATVATKQQLLASTKSSESTYQTLLQQKEAQEKAFESELSSLQNQLKGVPASEVPQSGSGILSWPFSASVMQNCVGKQSALGNPYCITQYFGNTPFATANAAIYSGMGHDGVDIGVPIGTPVQAALSGVVAGTGDTDLVHDSAGDQCYSFGNWIMIQHANGLNTMYAHLSKIGVTKGQQVSAGDVIGYSGMTGYATGPHLHFGVYATAGVKYMTLGSFHGTQTPCSGATMPVAPPSAYLNPLSYLPV